MLSAVSSVHCLSVSWPKKQSTQAGADGIFHGGGLTLLGHQVIAVAASVTFAFCASWILLKLIDLAIGLRVSPEQEAMGLDKGMHAEDGYVFAEQSRGSSK